jgi:hypothetical protein
MDFHWLGLRVTLVFFAFSSTAGASVSIGYAIDCYEELGANAIFSIMLVRNTMIFAASDG